MAKGQNVATTELRRQRVVGGTIETGVVVEVPVDEREPMAERARTLVVEEVGQPPEGELEQRLSIVVGWRHTCRAYGRQAISQVRPRLQGGSVRDVDVEGDLGSDDAPDAG